MDDGEEWIRLACESILNGDYEAAVERFEAAIAIEPDNAGHHYRCSITCARSGKWTKALRHAEEAVRLQPESEEYGFHLQTVRASLLLKRAEELLAAEPADTGTAIVCLEEAVRLDPLLFDGFVLLGATCGSLGRYDEAAAWLKAALELDPNHSSARRLFAEFSRKRRKRKPRAPGPGL